MGAAALFRGDWKITRTPEPWGDGAWRLFDSSKDPGEIRDVAAQHPQVFRAMQNEFLAYADDVGVYELPAGETAQRQIVINSVRKFSRNSWQLMAAVLAGLLALLYGGYRGTQLILRRTLG
jgi:arylsulfatase/uncharacterized sulfatase